MDALQPRDYRNIIALLQRANFNGIDEAEAGVILKQKILVVVKELENPPVEEEIVDDEDEDDGLGTDLDLDDDEVEDFD